MTKTKEMTVGYPLEDYKGQMSSWCVALQQRGYNTDNIADLELPLEILEECEAGCDKGGVLDSDKSIKAYVNEII